MPASGHVVVELLARVPWVPLIHVDGDHLERYRCAPLEIDDRFVGDGYGIPTPQSIEAIELSARREALFLDPTYTAKAMAGLSIQR
jgi:1-aminocyclopropane-1-carboxylate deaminase/D-cysteine desulfhydrase-like pyridoxal-dependent ACC family enzyme